MKRICKIFLMCFLVACVDNTNSNEWQGVENIDYFRCDESCLSVADKILLDNVDFRKGEIFCLIDALQATQKGVSQEKYDNFVNYLKDENQKISEYLDSGFIVGFNGKLFTRNEELLNQIDSLNQNLTRATEYVSIQTLETIKVRAGWAEHPVRHASFTGPAKISAYVSGRGTFTIKENYKNLQAILTSSGGDNAYIFKWGTGNNVLWNWDIEYAASALSEGTIVFRGFYEAEEPKPNDPKYLQWRNEMPSYVVLTFTAERQWQISINKEGFYSIRVCIPSDYSYMPYSGLEHIPGYYPAVLSIPNELKFWVVVYEEIERNNKTSYSYIGDILIDLENRYL